MGDETGCQRVMVRGVTQDSPLSPLLFNVYIDTLIEEASELGITIEVSPTLFAVDVIVFAATAAALERFLNLCQDWAASYGLIWAVYNCAVVLYKSDRTRWLWIQNEKVRRQKAVE